MGSAGQNAGLTAGAPAFCIAPDYPKRGAQRRGERILRCLEHLESAKSSRDGWECGEGERTLHRQTDHGEGDGGGHRVDFRRLRGVSANMENLTGDCGKKLDEGGFHDNLRFALITMNIIAGAGPHQGSELFAHR